MFYAAEFSMIGVSFNRDRKMGFVVFSYVHDIDWMSRLFVSGIT